QIFWGARSDDEHFQHLPDARGTEWAALGILVFVLLLFGVAPRIAVSLVQTSTVPLLERVEEARPPVSPGFEESRTR
ncbi:MAG: hypothetical protein OEW19_03645, partial [Acidobacteriota bacterium]|nr:hypothetical protein [Acidobacteriota bacterium]